MGGGGGKSSEQSHQTTKVELPWWVDQQAQANLAFGNQVAERPFQQYTGETIADLDPLFYQAKGMLPNLDDYYKNYSSASDIYNRVGNYNPTAIDPSSVTAGQFRDVDINQYLNPYIQSVETPAIRRAKEAGLAAQAGIASDATAKGAFGGSRQAVQQGVQGAETVKGIGDLSAQLRKEGYDTASGLAVGDIDRRLKAQTQTGEWAQQAQVESERDRLAANEARLKAGAGLTATAAQAQQDKLAEIMATLGFGTMSQEQKQRHLDRNREMWENEWNYPLEQLNLKLATLGMTPYGRTETTDKSSQSKSGGGMDIGGLIGGGLGLLKLLPALGASDRTLKTNIEKLGDVDGLPIYAYDYKSDVKAAKKAKTPLPMKRVGPMAQDVEIKYPQLVSKVAGKRVIKLDLEAA